MNESNEVILKDKYMVLAVPATAVEIEIKAKVWLDGEIRSVEKTMPFEEIRAAFQEADDCYIPSNATFSITDLGREELARLKAEQLKKFEEEDE